MQFEIVIGRDKHKIQLNVIITGEGINVLLTGGEKAHVGGVVLTVPRQSLTGSGIGSDSWVVPVPGHKDTIAGEKVGTIICRKTKEVVSVTAGIHIDNALPEDLEIIIKNCVQGAQMAASKIISLRADQK